jgi:hypothetical protein
MVFALIFSRSFKKSIWRRRPTRRPIRARGEKRHCSATRRQRSLTSSRRFERVKEREHYIEREREREKEREKERERERECVCV